MQIRSRLLLHDFKTHVSCSGRGLTTSQKLAGWISAWLPQRNLHYQVSVRGINQTLQRSKSIYDGLINSLLTLDKERPICAKGLKVSRSNVAPRGTNTYAHTHTDRHTRAHSCSQNNPKHMMWEHFKRTHTVFKASDGTAFCTWQLSPNFYLFIYTVILLLIHRAVQTNSDIKICTFISVNHVI